MTIHEEWAAILERRRKCRCSGADGRDFDLFLKQRGLSTQKRSEPEQLELFA